MSSAGLDIVQYGAFLPTATYSVANQLGIFTTAGLNVNFSQVASSTAAFASLFADEYDIITATFDNALNVRLNLNESVTVLGQLDQGPDLVIASVPFITDISQLRGKPLMVDSPASGFSFLERFVLATFGLNLDNGDYSFQTVGGTGTRFADLVAGALPNGSEAFATILTYPVTLEGAALPVGEAPNVLARISDFVAPVASSAFMARESSLSNTTQTALLSRFVASMLAANVFLNDMNNKECSVAAIAQQLNISTELAAQEYASATSTLTGEVSPGGNFTVNQEGALNDVNVRKMFGGFSGLPQDFDFAAALEPGKGRLIDYSVRDAATKLYKENGRTFEARCLPWASLDEEMDQVL